jgi:hypothetical protein
MNLAKLTSDHLTREELREWLDRKPRRTPWLFDGEIEAPSWRSWFDGDVYLGERSARVGPDDVGAAQRCGCEVCENGRDG